MFIGSAEAQPNTHETCTEAAASVQLVASSIGATALKPDVQQQLSVAPVPSLQLGNSDPFNSYAIPVGPRETSLLNIYGDITAQILSKASVWKLKNVDVVRVACLSDQAASYALLARNSAIEDLMLRGSDAEPSTAHLGYLTEAQAGLRRKLSLMTGTETASMICPIMWATCFLAYAEMVIGSPTAGLHSRAMSKLAVRYTELMGDSVNKADIIAVAIIDFMRACTTLTRPTIDMDNWFPHLFQDIWNKTGLSRSQHGEKEAKASAVHRDVKDKRLKAMIMAQREEHNRRQDLLEGEFDVEEAKLRSLAVHSQELFQDVQLLHIALDALERLGTPSMSAEQVQDQVVRAYTSFSVLLWLFITSAISFTTERLLNGTGKLLHHVQSMMVKDVVEGKAVSNVESYKDARLWALCVGVQTEMHRKGTLSYELACGEWFFEAFRAEVESREDASWQQVVSISEQFLSIQRMKPHISQWWHQVVPQDYKSARRGRTSSSGEGSRQSAK